MSPDFEAFESAAARRHSAVSPGHYATMACRSVRSPKTVPFEITALNPICTRGDARGAGAQTT